PAGYLGLDADAYLGNSIQLFFRVPLGVSVQRRESRTAICGRATLVAAFSLQKPEPGAGKEVRVSRVSMGRAHRGGECLQLAKSQRSGEQCRRTQFRPFFRRPKPSFHRTGAFRWKKIDGIRGSEDRRRAKGEVSEDCARLCFGSGRGATLATCADRGVE